MLFEGKCQCSYIVGKSIFSSICRICRFGCPSQAAEGGSDTRCTQEERELGSCRHCVGQLCSQHKFSYLLHREVMPALVTTVNVQVCTRRKAHNKCTQGGGEGGPLDSGHCPAHSSTLCSVAKYKLSLSTVYTGGRRGGLV